MRNTMFVSLSFIGLVAAAPAFAQSMYPGRPPADVQKELARDTRADVAGGADEFNRINGNNRAEVIKAYRDETEKFRQNAMDIAKQAERTDLPADAATRIRAALEADLNLWRMTFNVSKREWKQMHDQWLVDASRMDGRQWAAHRVNWFTARDRWIDSQTAIAR